MNKPVEKAHAEYSASAAARWLHCPGSMALSKKAPEQKSSRYAAEGTKAHDCLEYILSGFNRYKNLDATVRMVTHATNNGRGWTGEMIEHAVNAAYWVLDELVYNPGELLVETKVDTSPFICAGQFGTLDIAIVREFGRLTIADYKYGAGAIVEPEGDGDGNEQLICYALGLSHQYHHNFSEVELVVIQPRAWHESGETIRRAVFPMNEFLKWEDRFKAGYRATLDPLAPLNAGGWCKFCPAALICPEIKERGALEAQVVFGKAGDIESLPEPRMVNLPDLGTILNGCVKLEAWIKKVREHADNILQQGGQVDGWKLVQKRSTRKWLNEDEITQEAKNLWGAKVFTEPKLLSPAQLEKVTKAKEWVAERTSSTSSGTTLVTNADKREAVVPIENVFTAVTKGIDIH